MDDSHGLNDTFKTGLAIIILDAEDAGRRETWDADSEEFLKRVHRAGIELTIIGPKIPTRLGTKKNVRILDRHDVVSMKELKASRSHRIELRVLGRKSRSWLRLRAEACVVVGSRGLWPSFFDGWTLPGALSLEACLRMMYEFKTLPGRDLVFSGSTNRVVRAAVRALDLGAKRVVVVEEGHEPLCWRAHRDRFIARGGRLLLEHKIDRAETESQGVAAIRRVYLKNAQGKLIVDADTLVLSTIEEENLNPPDEWRVGMFYLRLRKHRSEPVVDEERWLSRLDWTELFWRVARFMDAVDHKQADGAIKLLKTERKALLSYRKPLTRRELGYSGKVLDRETMLVLTKSPSVPSTFARTKPIASLECLEGVPCRACADACPDQAIEIVALIDEPKLIESACTGCGACVAACPAGAAVMVQEIKGTGKARYHLPITQSEPWRPGKPVQLLNRKGEVLGPGKVIGSQTYERLPNQVVQIESVDVHLWDARNTRLPPATGAEDPEFLRMAALEDRAWITVNGTRRMSPTGVPISLALWQIGHRRFEDALLCEDGSCRLCEVEMDGKRVLACRTPVTPESSIQFKSLHNDVKGMTKPLCVCRQVAAKDVVEPVSEGVPREIACERTGLGFGVCHGRWCEQSADFAIKGEKLRPVFPGFDHAPWRDLWPREIIGEARPEDESEDD